MYEHFFKHVNIPPQNINIPSGTTSNYPAFCEWYEHNASLNVAVSTFRFRALALTVTFLQ
jgi:6-phosphogluconolactonase/glucosamine-6-phosphate isomerase/deaminase